MPVPQADETSDLLRFDQSGALLRKVMESAAVGMALIGVDRRLLYVNNAFCDMLARERRATLGADLVELVHPDDDAAIVQHMGRLIAGETEDLRVECRLTGAEAAAVWVLASGSLLRSDTTGRPLHVILQIINIDRQKQAEAALAYSESRWNFALEAAGQGVWDHDIRTKDMFYSRQWRTMRGFAPDEYVDPAQDEWLKRVHPDDVPRILATVDKQNKGEAGFETLEYRERHRDGHWIWILSRGRPVEWAPDGTPIRTVGTDTDITRLKHVEAQLAEEKERLNVTLRSIGDGVISTDASGRVTFMNPVAEAMTGWPSSEAIGRSVEQVFAIVDGTSGLPANSPVADCLARGETTYLEEDVVLTGADSRLRSIRSSAAPLRTPSGETIGAVLVFQDVTSSRTLQKQLAHSATHDPLTDLPNRLAFERALIAAADQAVHELRQHALVFLDLDCFKPVNDGAGHAAGDALLQQVAEIIRSGCRRQDFSSRLGGDEFALLLADCSAAAAERVVTSIINEIAAIRFTWGDETYTIGASAGIAVIDKNSAPVAELLGEADAACYAAKANGRGQVAVYGVEPKA